jgi:hypothetical protein
VLVTPRAHVRLELIGRLEMLAGRQKQTNQLSKGGERRWSNKKKK